MSPEIHMEQRDMQSNGVGMSLLNRSYEGQNHSYSNLVNYVANRREAAESPDEIA